MKTVSLSDALGGGEARRGIVSAIRKGDILIYPTDTVYGIGCDAYSGAGVGRIAKAKGSGERGFSVIAPSKEWIWSNVTAADACRKLADDLLPGPYTVVFAAAKVAPKAVVSKEGTIGIRMPRHPFTALVSEAGVPLVTTSVNLAGGKPAASLGDVPRELAAIASWGIDAGTIGGSPSRVFDMRTGDIKVLRR